MTETVIDLAVFRALTETAGADFVAELVGTFFEEAPAMLADLRSARDAADADRFRRAAHSLKSNSMTCGAPALGTMARELELRGMDAEPARDAAAIADLEAAYERAAAALKELAHG